MCYVYIAVLCASINGACNPLFGVIFSEIMNVLVVPLDLDEASPDYNKDDVRGRTQVLCILCGAIGVVCFLSTAISKIMFGNVGENVTL